MYHIYVHQNTISDELESVFQNLNHVTIIKRMSDRLLKISIAPSVTEGLIDFGMLHASIVSDFDTDTTLVYIHEKNFELVSEDVIIEHIEKMKHQVYDVSNLLIYMSRFSEIKYSIKRRLVDLLGQDYINTVLMIAEKNLNLSIAAKRLYLHRNSLNYRIEKIYQKTNIDVKSFHGLRALISIIEA